MNISTFNLQKLTIEALSETDISVTERYMISVLISQINKDLETSSTDVQVAKKVGCTDRMIKNIVKDELILSIFEIDRVKHKTTFYKLKAYSFMLFISKQLKDSKDKNITSIIEAFESNDLTINDRPLNYYQQYLFFDIPTETVATVEKTVPVEPVEPVKAEPKKEAFKYTSELKDYFNKNPHAKGTTKNYFVIAMTKIEKAMSAGYTLQEIFAEEQRHKKGFAYSIAVMLKDEYREKMKQHQQEIVKEAVSTNQVVSPF